MAVNLINSNDIEVEQTGNDIQLKTSTPLSTIEGNIGNLSLLNTTDKSSLVNAINELKNIIGGKVLWTNSSPTSDFAAQTINLSDTDYDMYEVICIYSTTENNHEINSGRIKKGSKARVQTVWGENQTGPYTYWRDITDNGDGTMTFTTSSFSYASSINTSNSRIVPLYVIGYKTGLFS